MDGRWGAWNHGTKSVPLRQPDLSAVSDSLPGLLLCAGGAVAVARGETPEQRAVDCLIPPAGADRVWGGKGGVAAGEIAELRKMLHASLCASWRGHVVAGCSFSGQQLILCRRERCWSTTRRGMVESSPCRCKTSGRICLTRSESLRMLTKQSVNNCTITSSDTSNQGAVGADQSASPRAHPALCPSAFRHTRR